MKYPELDERTSDILRMIFSNITSPENFPHGFGQIDDAISLLVHMADTPYDQEEMSCIRLFKQLVKHKWGCKNFFQNQKAIKYALDRGSHKMSAVPITQDGNSAKATMKGVVEKKYSLIH